jgi:hypothetical protein
MECKMHKFLPTIFNHTRASKKLNFHFLLSNCKSIEERSAPVVPAGNATPVVPALCRRKRHPTAQLSIRLRLELQAENNEILQLLQWKNES